eukprot:SAG31_NODE_2510_length_5586_cov_2.799344_1_plen_34_part_10
MRIGAIARELELNFNFTKSCRETTYRMFLLEFRE